MGYEFFKNSGNFTYDGEEPKELKHLARRGGFDLFIKLTESELDDDISFMHIETGLMFKIPD